MTVCRMLQPPEVHLLVGVNSVGGSALLCDSATPFITIGWHFVQMAGFDRS